MKGKKFLNTKNVVIGLVSCVLIGASATGVTIFLKDRGEAAAAQQQGPIENLPVTGSDEENNNQVGENTVAPEENTVVPEVPTTPGADGEETTDETEGTPEGTTGVTAGTASGTTGTTPSEEEIIAGITETTVYEERKVFEDLELSWTTIALSSMSTNMGIYKPELVIEKTAIYVNDEGITEETAVRPDDIITYEIKVGNIGNYKAINVVVTDSLDVIFDGKEVKAGETIATLEVLEPGKQAKIYVKYKVTQADVDATEIVDDVEVPKNIENIAYATDGKQTVQDNDKTVPVNPYTEMKGLKTWVVPEGTTLPEVTIELYRDNEEEPYATTTVNADGTYKFEDLPRYDIKDKHEYVYSVKEVVPDGYTSEQKGNNFINTIDQAYTEEISGTKTWVIPDGTPAPTITINLLKNGEVVDSRELKNGKTEYEFTELPKYKIDENGKYILDDKNMVQLNEYTVEEVIPDGYKNLYKSEKDGNNFINTKLVPDVDVEKEIESITKNGANIAIDEKATQGSVITYTITATNTGTTPLEHFKVTDTKNVTLVSVELPDSLKDVTIATGNITAGDNLLGNDNITVQSNESITFTVTYELIRADVIVENKTFINGAYAEGTYNSETPDNNDDDVLVDDDDDVPVEVDYIPPYGSKTFVKVWDDDNYIANRPGSITVQLMNGTTKVRDEVTITPDEDGNWPSYTWDNLPLEDTNGNTINYTVVEDEVPGYEASECTVNSEGHLTITNSYDVPTGTIISNWDIQSKTEAPVPVDVVFILDTSLSMTQNTTRGENMVTAVNNAIGEILAYNSNNRVAVVGFSEDGMYGELHHNKTDANVLLELGRYADLDNDDKKSSYLIYEWDGKKYNGNSTTKVYDVYTNVKKEFIENNEVKYEAYESRIRSFEQGTYTQAGIRLGAEQLLDVAESDTTVTVEVNKKEVQVQRVPVIILVSDGEPTAFTTNYSEPEINVETYDESGNFVRNNNKLGTGQLFNNSAIYGYFTILTANSYKADVEEHYGTDAKVFTIAMDLATHYGKTVLNPSQDTTDDDGTIIQGNVSICENNVEAENGIDDTLISQKLYTYLTATEASTAYYPSLGKAYTDTSKSVTAIVNPYRTTGYDYADRAFYESMTAEELKKAMIGSIVETTGQSTDWSILDEDADGLEELPNIDINGAFTIKEGTTTLYSSYSEAEEDGVVGKISGKYYLYLSAETIAGKNITVSYREK